MGFATNDAESESHAGSGLAAKRPPVTRLVFLKVDLAALQRGYVGVGEMCEIAGEPISIAEARRLLGDSILQLVLTKGEKVLDLVNLSRTPTIAQKLALLFKDSTCCVTGCDRSARLEFDHHIDWAATYRTRLPDLRLYCNTHHDEKTRGSALVESDGRLDMVAPSDPRHPRHRGPSPATPPAAPTPPTPRGHPTGVSKGTSPMERATTGTRGRTTSDDSSSRVDRGPTDLTQRIDRIRAKEARHQARLAGQGDLFDTG